MTTTDRERARHFMLSELQELQLEAPTLQLQPPHVQHAWQRRWDDLAGRIAEEMGQQLPGQEPSAE